MSRTREFDGRGIFKLGKRAGNRFDRKSKIIGDVLSRHWKLDIVAARAALGHFQQEAAHPLFRSLDQQQNMVLNAPQLLAGHRPQLAR